MNRYRDWQFRLYHRVMAPFPESPPIVPKGHRWERSFIGRFERPVEDEPARLAREVALLAGFSALLGVSRGTVRWPLNPDRDGTVRIANLGTYLSPARATSFCHDQLTGALSINFNPCGHAFFTIRLIACLTSRGQRFRHHHAAENADRAENHDPTPGDDRRRRRRNEAEGLTWKPTIREQCPPAASCSK
jgi:hypothetical protein